MNIWHRLGLDGPTKDIRIIKKAYSNALKTTRPEDDPKGFMALREAYDMASRHARKTNKTAINPPQENFIPTSEFKALNKSITSVSPAIVDPKEKASINRPSIDITPTSVSYTHLTLPTKRIV